MKYRNIVLSGGGVRGIYYLSLLKYFEDTNFDIKTFENLAGTSIGSFVAMAISIGYRSDELKPYLINVLDYSRVKSLDIFNITKNYGIDNGAKLEHYIKKMIRDKIGRKNITFNELYKQFNKNLIITTISLQGKQIVYLSKENYPNVKIWKAIRMSMSVPFLFKPYHYKNNHYIDGGIKVNFPIELFPNRDTLGVDLSGQNRKDNGMNFEEYILCLIDTIIRNNYSIKEQDIIQLNNSFSIDKPLLSFQPNLDEKIICEALEYSYKCISDYFKYRESKINEICNSIVNDCIHSI